VAALFAITTKVGVYAILRIFTLVFNDQGPAPEVAGTVLPALGLMTVVAGGLGVLGAQRLRLLIASLVVISVGTLVAGIGQLNVKGIAAALYYLPHTTWVTAGLFLLADMIAQQRGPHDDGFTRGPLPAQPARLGLLFFLGAVAAAGLPPLSGFIGKVLLLRSVAPSEAVWLWGVVLLAGLTALIALTRAGSRIFWRTKGEGVAGTAAGMMRLVPAALLLALSVLLTVFAAPVSRFTEAAALQLLNPEQYIAAVLAREGHP